MDRLKYVFLVFALLIIAVSPLQVHAEKMGTVYIEAHYSSNITPQSGDEFELVYMLQGGTDSATISLDASNYVEDTGMFELPEANYEIISITYKGSNPEIPEEGYGVRRDFVSAQDGGSYIYISIGTSANIALERNYEGALFVDPTNAINESEASSRATTYEDATDDGVNEISESSEIPTEVPVTEEFTENTESAGPDNHSTEEVEVEHYGEPEVISTETGDRIDSILTKLVGVGVLFVVGLVIIFILHKAKKI